MIDYSFFRLKSSFAEAKNLGDSPVTKIFYNENVQLLPLETYLQITNVEGGISFNGDYTVEIVDCSNIALKDITNNVFIEEFNDYNGNTQCAIEIVNINEDFYRQTVFLRFTHNISNAVYWSIPLNITDYQKEQTSFFMYKSYDVFLGTDYVNSPKYQAIRLKTYFDIPIDESETQDYYQISRLNTISARTLIKKFERYKCDYINFFTFERLNAILKHEVVYINNVRITDKPTAQSEDRQGDANFMITTFTASLNYNDCLAYSFQIFEGLQVLSYEPTGTFTLAGLPSDAKITFNVPITLQSGSVSVYDDSDVLQDTKTESSMSVLDNVLTISDIITDGVTINDGYYFNYTFGLISALSINNEAVTDKTTWTLNVAAGDYASADYDSNDYLTN